MAILNGFQVQSFPSNLGTMGNHHYMVFYIREQARTKYKTGDAPVGFARRGNAGAGANDGNKAILEAAGSMTNITNAAIVLPIPPTLIFSYDASYEDFENPLARALGTNPTGGEASTARQIMRAASGAAIQAGERFLNVNDTQASRIGLSAARAAVNPHMELMFKGVGFRDFSFAWTFYPTSEAESKALNNLITLFKFHMLPELVSAVGGRYFLYPSEFDIRFYRGEQENPNIPKISTVVLKSVKTDYAENGWRAFENGAPVGVGLTLDFQELEVMTKEKVREGF